MIFFVYYSKPSANMIMIFLNIILAKITLCECYT